MARAKTNRRKITHHVRRAGGAIKHQYRKRMPEKKHHRILIWTLFLIVVSMVAAQMLYPPSRALPLMSLKDKRVGFQSDADIAYRVNTLFRDMNVTVSAGEDASVKETIGAMGGEVDPTTTIEALTEYPFWQRFIPFSILFHIQNIKTVGIHYNQTILQQFANKTAKKLSVAPENATLSIRNGELVAVSEVSGHEVDPKAVYDAVTGYTANLGENGTIRVSSTVRKPATTYADFRDVRFDAEQALARPITITADDETFTPTKKQIASWLEIATDDQGNPTLAFSDKGLKTYLEKTVNKKVGRPAGTTIIHVVNGDETKRETGKTGRQLDYDALKDAIEPWIMSGRGTGEFVAEFIKLKPKTQYAGQYTSSQDGLRAYVNDASRDQNANIVIQQTNGKMWSANASGSMSIPSASTYKVYVAWMLFEKMNQGKIHWNDGMLGTNVSDCFDQMTIASTNACAEQWLSDFGRNNVNNFLYAHGYSHGTSFTNPVATHTTANDLAKFMLDFDAGRNIGGAHRDRLLHSLSVHPYRYGVPTGSKGQVWDKVGFLWDYVHDAAIVHHPKGNYIMVVMTKGRSYGTIAEITRRVEQIMYP